MSNYFWVFLGGGLGSICRYSIAHWMTTYRFHLPWSTIIANILACMVLGALVGLNLKNKLGGAAVLFLMTGFCGGFSTFSTFTSETFQLMAQGHWYRAFFNVSISLILCMISFFIGVKMIP